MSDTTPENENRTPITRPGVILSATLIMVLTAAVLATAFLLRNSPDAAAPLAPTETSPAVTAEPSPTQEAAADKSMCELPDSGETTLEVAPQTDWELRGTFAAPTLPAVHGPALSKGGVRSCFSHDVTGALYAAVNVAALVSSGQEKDLYSDLSVPSPAQERALGSITTPAAASITSVQVAGFRIASYTEQAAVVRIGLLGANGVNFDYPVPLEWHEGDWKLVVPPTGDLEVREVPDLTDFIPWSGA